MARTKGSKCRKTLARELGIDLDTYIRLEKEGKLEEFRNEVLGVQTKIEEDSERDGIEIIVVSEEKNKADEDTDTKVNKDKIDKNKVEDIEAQNNIDLENQNKSKIIKPRKNKSKKIIDPEFDNIEHKTEDKKIASENKIEVDSEPENKPTDIKTSDKPLTSSTKPIITPKTKVMIPGNEKDESEIQNDNRVVENKVEDKKNKNKSTANIRNSILCSRCHKAILKDSSHRIKLENLVPGIAEYRYNLKDDIWLCHDCAVGLSKWIEDFLDNEGEGCERKFGVVDEGEVEG